MTGALCVIVAVLLAGCASAPAIPDTPADIAGTITHVDRSGGRTTVLIEERPDQAAGDNKSSVRITPQTRILFDGPSGPTVVAPVDLTEGNRASAWFVGPVAESYPTRATARLLVVRSR